MVAPSPSQPIASALTGGERRLAGHSGIRLEQFELGAGDLTDPPTDELKLCLIRRGAARFRFDFGARAGQQALRPGSFAPITPAGVPAALHLDAPQTHLFIAIPAETCARIGQSLDAGARVDLGWLHTRAFDDPLLEQLCLRMWHEAREADPLGALFGDGAAALLISMLLRHAGAAEAAEPGLLSQALVARIRTFCVERVDQPIALRELAALAGLPDHRFIRAFRRTVGHTPYQDVLRIRIDAAGRLLRDTALPITEIAAAVGFADQAHFTTTFSRRTGMTPARYRNACRS